MSESQHIAHFGRFIEPAFLILISLLASPKHGYAMIEDIAQFSSVKLGAGTLYGAITRLEQQQFIEAIPSTDRRRPYQLTDTGRALLQAHLINLQRVTVTGLQRLDTI